MQSPRLTSDMYDCALKPRCSGGKCYRKRSADSDKEDDDDESKDCYLLDHDKVAFSGRVTRSSMMALVKLLYKVAKQLPLPRSVEDKPRLYLMLNTNGGSLYSALAAYDHMCKLKERVELVTVAEGFVASAGTVLLMAGSVRLAMRNAGLLFHQLSSGIAGKYADLKDEVESCRWLMNKLYRLYTRKSNLTREEVEQLLGRERTRSARKCISKGLVHEFY